MTQPKTQEQMIAALLRERCLKCGHNRRMHRSPFGGPCTYSGYLGERGAGRCGCECEYEPEPED